MERRNTDKQDTGLGPFALLVHLGLLVFGLAAAGTGLLADDYKKAVHGGFTIHSWIGMGLAAFMALRLATGLVGPGNVRFVNWMPFTRARMKLVVEDIAGLLKMRMPDRPTHQGLAGLVQTFGLAVFLFMAATGAYLYFFLEPGQRAFGFVYDVKELHEIGIVLIPLFLSFHAGAVVMHALRGNHLWKKMVFISDTIGKERARSEPPAEPRRGEPGLPQTDGPAR
jgi:cytochrome b